MIDAPSDAASETDAARADSSSNDSFPDALSDSNIDGSKDVVDDSSTEAGPPLPPAGTLAEYWSGAARWTLQRSLTLAGTGWPYGYGAGAHVEAVDGVWYLFSRQVHFSDKPAACAGKTDITFSTEVRRSDDEGATWSAPATILKNDAGSAWECAATDGDAWYDATAKRWHYLFQCLAGTGGWNGCHVTRDGSDPMGAFGAAHANPVLHGGDLWKKICVSPSARCVSIPGGAGKVFDEGTFDVVKFDGADYWVTFHGFDGSRGYRGVAKTPDFVTWYAGDASKGLPTDAIYTRDEPNGWRESWIGGTSIGGGAARIVEESGLFYMFIESGDESLGCIDGQDWDLGLLRAPSLATTRWDQFPLGNPIAYSSKLAERAGKSLACNPAYGDIFRDVKRGETWMHFTRESVDPSYSGIYFFRLEKTTNVLKNADLWECTADGWTRFSAGPTNLSVYRHPNGSTDSNCYLATNCGAASCVAGQSVYQDVDVSTLHGRTMRFGAKFLAEGPDAAAQLVVHELDASSKIVATHVIDAPLGAAWAEASGTFVVDPSTITARFQLYLNKPATIRMDEAFLGPT